MKVEMILVEKLVPYARNPRSNDNAVDAIAASIREFGFRVPVVCDEQYTLLTGHTRLKAAHRSRRIRRADRP
jgi:ParB-like chromosome segregation protein Spo0J